MKQTLPWISAQTVCPTQKDKIVLIREKRAFHEFEVSVFSIAMGLRGRYNENGGVCHEIISGSPWTNRYE